MTDLHTFDPLALDTREDVDEVELAAIPRGSFAEDARRVRPNYEEGRFLTARDLTRDQQYALIRQADLLQLTGGGIVNGLEVAAGSNPLTVQIAAGLGLTPNGETVVLRQNLSLRLADIPLAERLGDELGLDFSGDTRVGTRTGVFVLALRAVEYVEQPSLAFPTTPSGKASVEPGQITEATAVTCIPLDHLPAANGGVSLRSLLAREIFLLGGLQKPAGEALPLAVLALERGALLWSDMQLVRRRAGIDDVVSFGLGQRVAREAHWRQFATELEELLQARAQAGRDRRVIARDEFAALPATGILPRETVEVVAGQLVQWFFPPEFRVELSICPLDELPRLLEEALPQAAFDLLAPAAALEAMPVTILIPVARDQFSDRVSELAARVPQLSAAQNLTTLRIQPIDALDALVRNRFRPPEKSDVAVDLAPWERLLAGTPRLFYVRRRQIPPTSFIVPRFRPIVLSEADPLLELSELARGRLLDAGEVVTRSAEGPIELRRFDFLLRRIASANRANVVAPLSSLLERDPFDTDASAARSVLVNGVCAELAYRARARSEELLADKTNTSMPSPRSQVRVRPLRAEDVSAIAGNYTRATLGEGFVKLLDQEPQIFDHDVREVLAESLLVPALDEAALPLSDADASSFATELVSRALSGDLDGIARALKIAKTPRTDGQPLSFDEGATRV